MAADPYTASVTTPASAASVFRTLTDKDAIRHWWSLYFICSLTDITLDPRRGGSYRFDHVEQSGKACFTAGQFLHVSEKLIVMRWRQDDSDDASTVFIGIKGGHPGEGTVVTIEHRDLAGTEAFETAKKIWTRLLAMLPRAVAPDDGNDVAAEVEAFLVDHPEYR